MYNDDLSMKYELMCIIVNYGSGSKVLKIAKKNGVSGGTILIGRGTIKNCILEFLDLCESKKEIIFIIAQNEKIEKTIEQVSKTYKFHKPYHGIAFTMPIKCFVGCKNQNYSNQSEVENEVMYNSIFIIVNRGEGEAVMETATSVGAKGGTIINARGAGVSETSMLFSMAIEPEKEMVMILSETSVTDKIVEKVREVHKIDEPGNGVIFVQDIKKAYGIV